MASNFSKWSSDRQDPGDPLRVVLFISRNKDNRGVVGFTERREAFLYRLTAPDNLPEPLERRFRVFVKAGVPGEFARIYISVNSRKLESIKKNLMHRLIDDNLPGGPNWMTHMDAVTASLAAHKGCVAERKWLVDFDVDDAEKAAGFACYVETACGVKAAVHRTPHGYAILFSRGFDTRVLDRMPGYADMKDDISIKKDALLCAAWGRNEEGGSLCFG